MPRSLLPALLCWIACSQVSPAVAQGVLYTFEGPISSDSFGSAVAGIGDLNGDGAPELLVGSNLYRNRRGRVRLFSGLDGANLATFQGDNDDEFFGQSVSTAGDVDGDGVEDILIGMPGYSVQAQDAGCARVYSGASGALLGVLEPAVPEANGKFGRSVCRVGDVNADGTPDLAVGGYRYDANGLDSGIVTVFSGRTGLEIVTFTGDPGDWFGYCVAPAGDVNDDGVPDLIVGAPTGGSGGYAKVISGAGGAVLHTFSGGSGEALGWAVSGAGDLNGDGHGDLIVGDLSNDTNALEAGAVYVYSGSDGSLMFSFLGEGADSNLGYSVARAGDVNADGVPDIIAGAPSIGGTGFARVWSGADGSLIAHLLGEPGSDFGTAVAGAGKLTDVECERMVAVGAPEGGGTSTGYARVYRFLALRIQVFSPGGGPPSAPGTHGMVLRCATPNGPVLMAGGKKVNDVTPASACGLEWGIKNAIEFSATANQDGEALVVVDVPHKAAGRLIPVQGMDASTCTMTPVTMIQF